MNFVPFLRNLFASPADHSELALDYANTFSGPCGQRVLEHLLNSVYATVYEGRDAVELAHHNGRRAVIQEILENIEVGQSGRKGELKTETQVKVIQ